MTRAKTRNDFSFFFFWGGDIIVGPKMKEQRICLPSSKPSRLLYTVTVGLTFGIIVLSVASVQR